MKCTGHSVVSRVKAGGVLPCGSLKTELKKLILMHIRASRNPTVVLRPGLVTISGKLATPFTPPC